MDAISLNELYKNDTYLPAGDVQHRLLPKTEASSSGIVKTVNTKFYTTELHPPFSRVHYRDGGVVDSGRQGYWNISRGGPPRWDRSHAESAPTDRQVYTEDRMEEFSRPLKQTTFNRVTYHSNCKGGSEKKTLPRIHSNPTIQTKLGCIVGPTDNPQTGTYFKQFNRLTTGGYYHDAHNSP